DRPRPREMPVGPAERCGHRLRSHPRTLGRRREGPADLGRPVEARAHAALEIREAGLAQESARGAFLDRPTAIAQERPMPGIAQDLRPDLVDREGPAADMAGDARIAPHRGTIREIAGPMGAQAQPRSFDDGNDHVMTKSVDNSEE